MRILIVGANLAGLLSALQLHRQGHDICVLVHGPEGAHLPAPPLILSDPGPWGSAQGALATLSNLLTDRGDLRLGPDGLGHLGWLMRCLSRRSGSRARSHVLRLLALARRSQQALDELQGRDELIGAPQPVTLYSVYPTHSEARQQQQRGPAWHLGTPPTLSALGGEGTSWPQLDGRGGSDATVLRSDGVMLADGAAVLAGLRHHLMQQGVRFVYDHTIAGVEHTGQHLHGVTLRGTLNQADEVDCDWVVATSLPASLPLLQALGVKPDLAPMSRLSLRARLADSVSVAQSIHDISHGVRLIRQGQTLWAHGPTWLGEPEGSQAQELAHLSATITRHVGQAWTPVEEQGVVHTSWVAPDGLPVVSRTPIRNLFLNLGHHFATAHWAFGASAQLLSLMTPPRSSARPITSPSWPHSVSPLATSAQGSHHD